MNKIIKYIVFGFVGLIALLFLFVCVGLISFSSDSEDIIYIETTNKTTNKTEKKPIDDYYNCKVLPDGKIACKILESIKIESGQFSEKTASIK